MLFRNFRKNRFHLFNQEVTVAGMAGPHNSVSSTAALQYLKRVKGTDIFIGIHEDQDFTKEAREQGLEYHFIQHGDHSGLNPRELDTIYRIVKDAAQSKKSVAIHCGAGMGRTGVALASLKLRELLEKEYKEDPSLLEKPVKKSEWIYTDSFDWKTQKFIKNGLRGRPLVIKAIKAIREECFDRSIDSVAGLNPDWNWVGKHSVEIQAEVDSLMEYEKHLRQAKYLETHPLADSLERRDTPYFDMLQKSITQNNVDSLSKLKNQDPEMFERIILDTNNSSRPLLCVAADDNAFEAYNFLLNQGATEYGSLGKNINIIKDEEDVPNGYIKMLKIAELRQILSEEKQLKTAVLSKIDLSSRLNALYKKIDKIIDDFVRASNEPIKQENLDLLEIIKKLLMLLENFPYPRNRNCSIKFSLDELYLLSPAANANQSSMRKELLFLFNESNDQHLIYPTSGIDYRLLTFKDGCGNMAERHDKTKSGIPYGPMAFSFDTTIDPKYSNLAEKEKLDLLEKQCIAKLTQPQKNDEAKPSADSSGDKKVIVHLSSESKEKNKDHTTSQAAQLAKFGLLGKPFVASSDSLSEAEFKNHLPSPAEPKVRSKHS